MATGPNFGGIALRALAALALVFATYNPEGKSFYHWAVSPLIHGETMTGPASVKFLAGLARTHASRLLGRPARGGLGRKGIIGRVRRWGGLGRTGGLLARLGQRVKDLRLVLQALVEPELDARHAPD